MTTTDPYAPPKSRIAEPKRRRDILPTAGLGRRLLNYVIDAIAAGILLVAAEPLLVHAIGTAPLVHWLVQILFMISFYVTFEGLLGRTPGKFLTGTKVVDTKGESPSFAKILGRTCARFIPFEPLSFVFADRSSGWHDTLSGTRVVLTDPSPRPIPARARNQEGGRTLEPPRGKPSPQGPYPTLRRTRVR